MFSVVVDADADLTEVDLDEFGEAFVLSPHLGLVLTDLTLSGLYHNVEWRLPNDSALFVAEVTGTPKMKGQAAGAVTWTREAVGRN